MVISSSTFTEPLSISSVISSGWLAPRITRPTINIPEPGMGPSLIVPLSGSVSDSDDLAENNGGTAAEYDCHIQKPGVTPGISICL